MEGRKLKLSMYEILTSTSLFNICRKADDEEEKEQNIGLLQIFLTVWYQNFHCGILRSPKYLAIFWSPPVRFHASLAYVCEWSAFISPLQDEFLTTEDYTVDCKSAVLANYGWWIDVFQISQSRAERECHWLNVIQPASVAKRGLECGCSCFLVQHHYTTMHIKRPSFL